MAYVKVFNDNMFYTTAVVAKILQCNKENLRKYAKNKIIPAKELVMLKKKKKTFIFIC